MKILKKIAKIGLWVVLSLVLLNVLLYLLLLIPCVQQSVLDFALGQIRPIIKTEVRIHHIQLHLFNRVELEGVCLEDRGGDTLVYAKDLSLEMDVWKIFQNRLVIESIQAREFLVNVYRKDSASDYNFQFLIDAFASKKTVKKESKPLDISIDKIELKKGAVRFETKSEPQTKRRFNPAHIQLTELSAMLSIPSMKSSKFDIRIGELAFKEQSGLELQRAQCLVKREGAKFFISGLVLQLPGSKLDIPSAEYDILQQAIKLQVKQSGITPEDISCFYSPLAGLKDKLLLEGAVGGELPSIALDSLRLSYGKSLELIANGQISNYKDYKKSKLRLVVQKFVMSQNALHDLARMIDHKMVIPAPAKATRTIHLKGTAEGNLANMVFSSDFWTKQGAVSIKGKMSADSTLQQLALAIGIKTQNYNLYTLTNGSIGRVAGDIRVEYKQKSKQQVTIKSLGTINSIQYGKETFQHIQYTAQYSPSEIRAMVHADTKQGLLQADLKIGQGKVPSYAIKGSVQNLKVNAFYSYAKWKNPLLSVDFVANIAGELKNGFQGTAELENLKFADGEFRFTTPSVRLESGKNKDEDFMELTSSFLNARIDGKVNLATLTDDAYAITHRYLPQFIRLKNKRTARSNDFRFSAQTKDTRDVEKLLSLPFSLSKPLTLSGQMNAAQRTIKMEANAPLIQYTDAQIKASTFNLSTENDQLHVAAHSEYVAPNNRMELDLNANADSDTIRSQINFSNTTPEMEVGGQLDSYAFFARNLNKQLVSHLNIEPSMLYVNDLRCLLNPASIVNEGNRTFVSNLGMQVDGKNYLNIGGTLSDSPSDTLHLDFTKARLSAILFAFSIKNIDALLNGKISIASAMKSPQVFTEGFRVDNIMLYGDSVGSATLASRWQDESKAIDINASLEKKDLHLADVTGLIYTKDTLQMDLNVKLEKLPMNWIQPFVSDYLNKLNGDLSANIELNGSVTDPDIKGWLGIKNGEFGVQYTNVNYKIADTIQINRGKIGFDSLQVTDPFGHKASLSADITRNNSNKIEYVLNARMNNFLVLNTESRSDSLFYGKMFVSGTTKIQGNTSGMDIQLNVNNGPDSKLNVLLPQTAQAVEYRGIVYINTPQEDTLLRQATQKPNAALKTEASPFLMKLNSNVRISDDLPLYILVDPQSGNTMEVSGNGLINFVYDNSSGDMRTFGNYTITKGTVKVNLQQLSNMEFTVEEGSKLVFRGDPTQTTFDITAYKDLRADLTTLDASFATDANISSTRIPVRCVLGIKGNMNQMNLTYNVELPEASDDVQSKVKSLIATEEQRIQQFVYLLFANSFYSNSGNSVVKGLGVNGVMTSVASGTLNKTLDAVFGKILGDKWDINTDLASTDGTFSNMDVDVNVSTRLLNNRLRIRTNLGYRSASDATTTTTSSQNLIGNLDVEYLLNRSLKLKVYSKENDKYYRQATTTQGIGIVYSKEVKNFKNFWNFLRKKKKENVK